MRILAVVFCLFSIVASHAAAEDYYAGPGVFSMRPSADAEVTHMTRFGPVGLSLDLLQPAFTIRIKSVEAGSPAADTGALKPGQYIVSINGETLADIDPRIQLGNLITQAEASDGRMVLSVADEPGGATRDVVVQLPVLGAYSATWPMDCPKSDRIVRDFAEYLKQPGSNQGFADIGMLFLLSTGDDSDLAHVAKWAKRHKGEGGYPWHIGYGGLALCEYYLRTGDDDVLPAIQKLADKLAEMENFGGWVGRGPIAQLTYGGGGGHLNAAGVHGMTFLMLALECGIEVPQDTVARVTKRFYRYAARGNVPYGMGRPEGGYTDNGKNGKLTYAMAAAANLVPDGEQSIYARARDASAQFSFYSTTYMLHGHTGGGIGEIWRSAAMGLMHEKLAGHYRKFMDGRRWHYEMSRRHDGSFAILGGDRYDNETWGAAYALTYTVPRKTLRLTGAPRSKFAHTYELPERPWGVAEDDEYQSIEPATDEQGRGYDLDDETLATHSGLAMVRRSRQDFDLATIDKYIRHPDIVIRGIAASDLKLHGEATVMRYLRHHDARVRGAALDAVLRSPKDLLTRSVFDHVLGMATSPEESWFNKDFALRIVGKAPADWIVPQVDMLLAYLGHEEWWLREAALSSLLPVAGDERVYQKVLPAIGDLMETEVLFKVVGGLKWSELPDNIKSSTPQVQKLARETLQKAYTQFNELDHPNDRVEQRVNPTMRENIAQSIVLLPGGYDALYEIGKQRYPDQDLPFRSVFLAADPSSYSPELRAIVDQAVGGSLIPDYIARHRESLQQEALSDIPDGAHQMPGLVALYNKLGIDQYNWHAVGPEQDEMVWHYHSFDPPERWLEPDDRLGRYRDVTFPEGMDNWYTPAFDPEQHGWKQGPAPFGAADGELERFAGGGCSLPFCGCGIPLNTLWENDVLLITGEFEFPPFEEGYRYRLLHGGISHVGMGGGYRLYVNGKLFIEDQTGVDRRGGARPEGRIIPREWWDEFADGKVTLSAITFKKHHPRTKKYGGHISIFMEKMKVPPLQSE